MAFNISYLITAKDKFTEVAKKVQRSTEKMSNGMKKANIQLAAVSKNFKSVGSKMNSVGSAMTMRVTAPLVLMGTAALKATADFEKGLTNVLTLMDKPSIKKFGGDLSKIQNNAVLMGFSVRDSSKALFDTVSAMGVSEKSMKTFQISQKLAIGGVTELSVAVDGMTSIINAYGKEQTKSNEVANAFFSAQRAGKTTVAALASNVGKVAPIAKAAGIGFKPLLAAMSQLTLGGLSTEEASTALRGAISSLIKPGAQARKILKKLGIPFGATQIKAAGLGKVLLKLTQATEKYPDALALAIPNIRAFTAVSAFGAKEIQNMDNIIKNINKDIKAGTGLNDAYAAQMGTFTQKVKMFWGELKALANTIGKIMRPYVEIVIDKVRGLMKSFNELSPVTKKIIVAIVAIAAAFGPLLIGLGLLVKVVGVAMGALAIFASPIALIIAGVVALGAGLYYLLGGFSGIKKHLSNLWSLLKQGANGFINMATGAYEFLTAGKVIETMVVSLKSGFTSLLDIVSNLFKKIIAAPVMNIAEKLGVGEELKTMLGVETAKQVETKPVMAMGTSEQKFRGNLDINIRDKNKNIESTNISTLGNLNVGINSLLLPSGG